MNLDRQSFGVLALVLALVELVAPIAHADTSPLHFQGQAQVWTRTCNENHCPLPIPLGEPHPIEFELSAPTESNQIAIHSVQVSEDATQALITTYVHSEYVVVQVKLTRTANGVTEPLAECNQYHSLAEAVPFVVGVCSGFLPDRTQWGITLSRVKEPQSKAQSVGSSPVQSAIAHR